MGVIRRDKRVTLEGKDENRLHGFLCIRNDTSLLYSFIKGGFAHTSKVIPIYKGFDGIFCTLYEAVW